MRRPEGAIGGDGARGRTPADVSTLLVELGRAVKGWGFYGAQDHERGELLDRCWRAWRGDLERHGELELTVRDSAFWLGTLRLASVPGWTEDLASALETRGLRRLRFQPDLDAPTLAAFFERVIAETEELERRGGFEASYHRKPRHGLAVNDGGPPLARSADLDPDASGPDLLPDLPPELAADPLAAPELEPAGPLPSAPADAGVAGTDDTPSGVTPLVPDPDATLPPELPAAGDTTPELPLPPEPEALELAGAGEPDDLLELDEPGDAPAELEVDDEPEPLVAESAPTGPAEPHPRPAERAPGNPSPGDPRESRAFELVALIDELDGCDDDARYRDLASHVLAAARDRVADGALDEGYRTLLAFAAHASDDEKRSHSQRETAQDSLERLAGGPCLPDLIARACVPTVEDGLRASEVLVQLGDPAVRALLDHLAFERDANQRARLRGLLIAMGDRAVPAVSDAVAAPGEPARQRAALRLAGETQNPALVPPLGAALLSSEGAVAREAAKSLVRIGDVSALEALVDALRSERDETVALAAYSLGSSGRALCVAPLAEALERTIESGRTDVAREVVRGLGKLGRAAAVPAIDAVLSRGGMRRRKQLRDLKLAAVSALAQIGGPEAEATLRHVSDGRDGRLRRAADQALQRVRDRRASSQSS
ncbi:MAG: HEAT repeat domain-containing protein [Myxococcota bacterium]|nr:HEAT repeat domain-containing protein [Myxococcota bacterium]